MAFSTYDVLMGAPAPVELQNISFREEYFPQTIGGFKSDSGIAVDHNRALGHPVLLQGVKILAGAFAQMRVSLMRETRIAGGKKRIEEVRRHPGGLVAANRSRSRELSSGAVVTICQYRGATMNHAIMGGDGFGAIQRDVGGRPLQKTNLPPYPDTRVEFNDAGRLKVVSRIAGPRGVETFRLDPIDVFQVQNLSPDGLSGYPLTELAANAIGQGLAGYKFAGKSWANDARPNGILTNPGFPDAAQQREQLTAWHHAHGGLDNVAKIALLTGGTTYHQMAMSHMDAQLVEYLDNDVKTQARLLNMPPFLLGMTESSGLKMAELIAFFVQFTLGNWICNWAEQMRIKLLTEEEWRKGELKFVFDVSDFLTTNYPEHVKTMIEAVGGPVLTRPESRAMLKLNPDVDDEEFLERATGSKPTMGEEQPDDETDNRLEAIENRLRRIDIEKAKSLCHAESQKVSVAVQNDGFEAWAGDFYGGEWRGRLADRFSAAVAEKYCETRKAELTKLLGESGRSAVEADLKNYNARGVRLVEMELSKNGQQITHAKKE